MKTKFTILICCILFSFNGYSQNLKTIKHYYGFTSQLSEVYTVISGTGTKHGNYKSYDRNGFLGESLTYKNNRLNGTCTTYKTATDANGKQLIKAKLNYLNGQRHGKQWYYELGYTGVRNVLEEYSVYDKGTMTSQTTYYSDGNKKSSKETTSTSYTDISWYENDQKRSEEYRKVIDGIVVENGTDYYVDGKISRTYKADQNGNKTINEYYPDGQSKYEEKLVSNNGGVISYYQDGNKKEIYNVVDDKITETTKFDQKGKETYSKKITSDNTTETKYDSDGSKETIITYFKDGRESIKRYNKDNKITFEEDVKGNKINYTYKNDHYIVVNVKTGTIMTFNNDDILLEKYIIERSSNGSGYSRSYEKYSLTGKVIERGSITESQSAGGGTKQYIKYNELGNKIEELKSSGDRYAFYDNGNYKKVQFKLNDDMRKYAECTIKDCIIRVHFYDNKAIEIVGRLDETGEIPQGLWYCYNLDNELVEVEENEQKIEKIKKSHRKSGESLVKEVRLALGI